MTGNNSKIGQLGYSKAELKLCSSSEGTRDNTVRPATIRNSNLSCPLTLPPVIGGLLHSFV